MKKVSDLEKQQHEKLIESFIEPQKLLDGALNANLDATPSERYMMIFYAFKQMTTVFSAINQDETLKS